MYGAYVASVSTRGTFLNKLITEFFRTLQSIRFDLIGLWFISK